MEVLNFQNRGIRTIDYNGETWYSAIDIVGILSDASNPGRYWSDMKRRLDQEGSDLYANIVKLKSPNAEPFKIWLANAGEQNIQETENPELLLDKIYDHYRDKGMNDTWISSRIRSMEVRKNLTKRWQDAGVTSSKEYAFLTNIISKGTFDLTVAEHKRLKGLAQKHNIRDNMSTLELIYIILAEVTASELSEKYDAQGYSENENVARQAGHIAGESRKRFEKKTGLNVITPKNNLLE